MPVDFFTHSCANMHERCLQQIHPCMSNFNLVQFGISDANSSYRIPAQLVTNEQPNDFEITNNNGKNVQYKAIDYCIEIFRTGNYELDNDNREPILFSSDSVPDARKHLIKRCEGFLIFDNNILFFEIKTGTYGSWLKDAREKFEETILSFREHHSNLNLIYLPPIISNKKFKYKIHQNEAIQKKILKDKIQLEFVLQPYFNIL